MSKRLKKIRKAIIKGCGKTAVDIGSRSKAIKNGQKYVISIDHPIIKQQS